MVNLRTLETMYVLAKYSAMNLLADRQAVILGAINLAVQFQI
jgi:hypothetical protein